MTLALRYAARSDVGLLREGNEDAMYAGPRLLAVADGMGGHAAGEVASAVAISSMAEIADEPLAGDPLGALTNAVDHAQQRLREMVEADPGKEGMGTTLTALLRTERRLGLVHVGDSRAYRLRGETLEQLTHDHTLVQALVDEGRITAEEAQFHPRRSLLMRALDGHGEVELDLSVLELQAGDRYLLCTDGLPTVVTEDTIREVLGEGEPQAAADQLVELALKGGGPDNVTVIVADVVDAETPVDSQPLLGGAAAPAAATETPAQQPTEPVATAAEPTKPPRRRRWRRWMVGGGVAVFILVAAAIGGWLWLRAQYYVGVAAGQVAIYRGISQSVGSLHLSTVAEKMNLPLTQLPQYEQERVRAGIGANSLAAARRVASRLRAEATP